MLFPPPGQLDELGDVEDERWLAVAKNGGAAHVAQGLEQLAERLDDGLYLANQAIHHDAGTMVGIVHHHHELGFVGRGQGKQLAQDDEGHPIRRAR